MRRESELANLTWVRVQVDYSVGNADSNRHCPNIPKLPDPKTKLYKLLKA